MTTANEDLVINLLMNSGDIDAKINSIVLGFNTANERVQALILSIQDFANMANVSFAEASAAFQRFNQLQPNIAGAGGMPQAQIVPNILSQINVMTEAQLAGIQQVNQAEQQRAGQQQVRAEQENLRIEQQAAAEINAINQRAQREQDARAAEIVAINRRTEAAMQSEAAEINAINQRAERQQAVDAQEMATAQTLRLLRQNEGMLAGVRNISPADQIRPVAQFMNQMRESGADMQVVTQMLVRDFGILPPTLQKASKEAENLRNGFGGMAREAFNLSSIMNVLFGVGLAMIVFQLTQAIGNFVQSTLKQVKDIQLAIGSLAAAERAMSENGIEVTGKQLLDIVDRLGQKWTNISQTDLLAATGELSLKLADKGITPAQLETLMNAMMAAQVKNPGKTLSDIQTTMSTALLSDKYEGIRALGYNINPQLIQQKAMELGYITEINQKLTDQEKTSAKIAIIYDTYLNTEKSILGMQNNLSNASLKFNAAWENLASRLAPIVNIWNEMVFIAATLMNTWVQIIDTISGAREPTTALQRLVRDIADLLGKINQFSGTSAILKSLERVYEIMSKTKISEQPTAGSLAIQDTPTGVLPNDLASETEDNASKIKSAIQSVVEAMESFGDRARKMQEDFAISMKKMADDFALDQERFLQDWGIDRQKIIDDSNKAIEKKNKDYHDKTLNDEAKFQEQLRYLREKYLFDLDDALHERDARAVLKLSREYALNRQHMINEFEISQRGDANNHANEIAQIIKERDDRLAQLDAERALKLARMKEDFKIKTDRAIAEHKLEMDRLEHEKNDRLRQIADSLAQQLKLNQQGADAIFNMMMGYFGPNGKMADMTKWSYDNIVAWAAAMASATGAIAANTANGVIATTGNITGGSNWSEGQSNPPTPPYPTSPAGEGYHWQLINNNWVRVKDSTSVLPNSTTGFANGGVAMANKATTVTFGEAGTELAAFLPLSKIMQMFGAAGGGSSSGGGSKMELMVTLSPDLETRIVNKSVDNVTNAIMQVRKARS